MAEDSERRPYVFQQDGRLAYKDRLVRDRLTKNPKYPGMDAYGRLVDRI